VSATRRCGKRHPRGDHRCDVPLWNEGLTREGYGRWNAIQLRTKWGRDHLLRFALLDDSGRWVASAKRYLWPMRLDGVDGIMCGFGAVFTRPEERGRGYAGLIIDQVIERARGEGATVAACSRKSASPFTSVAGSSPCRSTKWMWWSNIRLERRRCSFLAGAVRASPALQPYVRPPHPLRRAAGDEPATLVKGLADFREQAGHCRALAAGAFRFTWSMMSPAYPRPRSSGLVNTAPKPHMMPSTPSRRIGHR